MSLVCRMAAAQSFQAISCALVISLKRLWTSGRGTTAVPLHKISQQRLHAVAFMLNQPRIRSNIRSKGDNVFARISSTFSLSIQDYVWLTTWAGMVGYFFYKTPVLMGVLTVGSLAAFALNWVGSRLPYFNQQWRTRIRPWHLLVPIGAIALTLNTITPAHAIFLSGMEAFVKEIATQSAGGGEGISEESIGLVFNLIRAIFLLLVAAAALFAYNQAQQGNDWRPIATQVGLAFGIVLGLDVITAIFVPQGGAGG